MRQGHASFRETLRLIADAMRASNPTDPKLRTSLKSILTNTTNRLWTFAIEEGALLLLKEPARKELVRAFLAVRRLSIDDVTREPFERLCDCLERCHSVQIRLPSHLYALDRLIERYKASAEIVKQCIAHVGFEGDARERAMRFVRHFAKSEHAFPFKDGKRIGAYGTFGNGLRPSPSLTRFGQKDVVPKNKEFAIRRLLDCGIAAVMRFPKILGIYDMEEEKTKTCVQEAEHVYDIPTDEELRGMHVIDRHCGGSRDKWSALRFAATGARLTRQLPTISESKFHFTADIWLAATELEDLYVAEKLAQVLATGAKPPSEFDASAFSSARASVRRRGLGGAGVAETSAAETTSTTATLSPAAASAAIEQIGFKDWTLRVATNRLDTKAFPELARLIRASGCDVREIFIKHEIEPTTGSLLDLGGRLMSTPPIAHIAKLSKEAYAKLQTELEARILPGHKYEKVVGRASRANRKAEMHFMVFQPFLSFERICYTEAAVFEKNEGDVCRQLLDVFMTNYLLPLSDFNGFNVGLDLANRRVYRYDLNVDDRHEMVMKRRRRRGFATAQRWSRRLTSAVGGAIERASEENLRACVTRALGVLRAATMEPDNAQLAGAFLKFAEGTDLAHIAESGGDLKSLCRALLQRAVDFRPM
eukprot:g3556.t1